jgi:SAM-dependent methyltransferase
VILASDGQVEYVDHLSTEDLREKYATDPGVDINEIVPVSYVWGTKTLPQAVGNQRFDYVLASHVIEHVPDPIGWFREISAVLKPGGVLSLAIPDKRWTFDCRREVTSVSAMIESYLLGSRQPSIRQVVDHFCEFAPVPENVSMVDLWRGKVSFKDIPEGNPEFYNTFGEEGLRVHFEAIRSGTYIDSHCSVFTPFSFFRILGVLARLRLIDFRVIDFHDTPVHNIEFVVALEKLPDSLDPDAHTKAILDSLPAIPAPLLEGEIEALRLSAQIDVLNSVSWRITEPLRALRRLFTRIF